jgi:hypothetical protein
MEWYSKMMKKSTKCVILIKITNKYMKKYFFLAGLPRSGNTLLSSILNQNKRIKCSANSPVSEILYNLDKIHNSPILENFGDHSSLNNLICNSFNCYYQNWNCDYVIDRGPWGTPTNLNLLKKYLNQEIKVIVLVRSIVDILSSFIRLNPYNMVIDLYTKEVNSGYRFEDTYKSDIEVMCEVLMSPTGLIEKELLSLHNLMMEANKKSLHILEYDDLVSQPEKSIKSIYKFLEISDYKKHNFDNIEQFSIGGLSYTDRFVKDLHKLKAKVEPPNYKVSDILPENIIKKYSNMEFWRN